MIGLQMDDREIEPLIRLIDTANGGRRRAPASHATHGDDSGAEARLDSLFGTSERLAVYGSLAPGRQNHHIVQPFGGTWTTGIVEGDLREFGWGAAIGFRALTLCPGGPAIPVHVLTSRALRAAWAELDAFEGPEYRRVLVPVWSAGPTEARTLLTVANLYEAAAPVDVPLDFRAAD
jgi:gamma-glutamylcyclotransferase (GGCT)/AIG2-like uncharacterized protein YtfP